MVIGNKEYEQVILKPCPFCGGKAVVHVNDGVRVVCTECGAKTKILLMVIHKADQWEVL